MLWTKPVSAAEWLFPVFATVTLLKQTTYCDCLAHAFTKYCLDITLGSLLSKIHPSQVWPGIVFRLSTLMATWDLSLPTSHQGESYLDKDYLCSISHVRVMMEVDIWLYRWTSWAFRYQSCTGPDRPYWGISRLYKKGDVSHLQFLNHPVYLQN